MYVSKIMLQKYSSAYMYYKECKREFGVQNCALQFNSLFKSIEILENNL